MIDRLAHVPRLLLACDFDGTLAPIVPQPELAQPLPRAVDALRRLADLNNTTVAIVSGRSRAELTERFDNEKFVLIGEHGADAGNDVTDPVSEPIALAEARRMVDRAVAVTPGSHSEHKAQSVVFHYRNAPMPDAALDRLRADAAGLPGIKVLDGKKVLEFSAAEDNKGTAIARLKSEVGAQAVLFVGDDVTDESVFAVLGPSDMGVKVGPGDTLAEHRIEDPEAVAALLEDFARRREA